MKKINIWQYFQVIIEGRNIFMGFIKDDYPTKQKGYFILKDIKPTKKDKILIKKASFLTAVVVRARNENEAIKMALSFINKDKEIIHKQCKNSKIIFKVEELYLIDKPIEPTPFRYGLIISLL